MVALCGTASYGPLTTDNTMHVAVTWALLSLPWLLLIEDVFALPRQLLKHARNLLLWTFLCCSVLLLPNTDTLSDDAHRYRWDGYVALHGYDPYAHAPTDSTLESLGHISGNVIYPADINHNHLRTVYPPGAQIVFQGITFVFGTHPLAFKLGWVLICMCLIGITLALVRRTTHTGVYYLAVLLSPIMLMHGFLDIHLDVLMALVVGVVLLPAFASMGWTIGRSFGMGLAITMKYLPILLLPLLITKDKPQRKRITLHIIIISGTIALLYTPFQLEHMHDTLGVYASRWQGNSLLSLLLQKISDPLSIRIILGLSAISACIYAAYRYRDNIAHATSVVLASILVFSPVIHPWYLALPLIVWVVIPSRTLIAWTFTMFLYGFIYVQFKIHGSWVEPPNWMALQQVPVFIAYWLDVSRGPLTLGAHHRTERTATA